MKHENLYEPDCIRTFSGNYINLVNPAPETIEPIDIAVGLARECRFGGHTKRFYSVAEHSMWCADKAVSLFPYDEELPFKILLHDAHEAYIKDIPSPIKRFFKLQYDVLSEKLQAAIHQKFNVRISPRDAVRIHRIDVMALEWEFRHKKMSFTGFELDEWTRIDLFTKEFVKLCPVPVVL
jgi:hypothetical protein